MTLSPTAVGAALVVLAALPATAHQASPIQSELDLGRVGVQMLDLPDEAGQPFLVDLEIDGVPYTAELHPHSLRALDFTVMVQGADGELRPHAAPEPTTYRGLVYGLEGSEVRASLTGGELNGIIRRGGDLWGVQPARTFDATAPAGAHVVYHDSDVEKGPYECGVDTAPVDRETTTAPAYLGTGYKLTEIAFDADVQFFNQNGGSVNNTIIDIENVMNTVETWYENDVNVTFEITVIIVRTAEPDPYSTTSSGSLLGQLSNEWGSNQFGYRRDVTHLMTGKNLDGSTIGIAGLGSLCSAYGLSQSKFSGSLTLRAALTAHEVGHNFNAQHCNGAVGGCEIMCSGIGGCNGFNEFRPVSQNSISNKANSVNCLINLAPPIAPPFVEPFATAAIDTDSWISLDNVATSQSAVSEPSTPYSLEMDATGPAAHQQDEIRSNAILLGTGGPYFLSFYSQHSGVEAGEELVVEYLQIGEATWAELVRLTSDGVNETTFKITTVQIPALGEHDGFKVRFRTEVDQSNDNWFIDEISVSTDPPCPLPFSYCTGKMSSEGCVPIILSMGTASLTDTDPFEVQAFLVPAVKPGLMFYGYGPAAIPFQDATLCILPPTKRTATQLSSGSIGLPCDGVYTFDMNAIIQSGLDPNLVEGASVNAQYWFRDNGVPSQTGLSDGLQFEVCP